MKTNYQKGLSKDLLFDWLCRLGDQYQTSFVVSDPDSQNNPLVYVNDLFYDYQAFLVKKFWVRIVVSYKVLKRLKIQFRACENKSLLEIPYILNY